MIISSLSSSSSYLFILTYSMTLILPPTQSLYPVLELLVDDADAVLQQAARTSLDRIAIYLGYSTTSNLLKYVLRTYLARYLYCIQYSCTDRYAFDRYFSVHYRSHLDFIVDQICSRMRASSRLLMSTSSRPSEDDFSIMGMIPLSAHMIGKLRTVSSPLSSSSSSPSLSSSDAS